MRHTFRLAAATMLVSAAAAFAADDYVMLKVNNQPITAAEIQKEWQTVTAGAADAPAFADLDEKVRQNVLRGIASERLIYGEAVKQGTDKNPEVARQLEAIRKKLVVKTFLESKVGGDISEAALRKEYDKMVADAKSQQEVRARHILVPTEDAAKALKARLDKGESFEKLAGEASKDSGTAKQGGDLGYFTRDKMVSEFADAAFRLEKGKVSAPVKSPFGWHIIKVEDKRNVAPPTYSDVKEQLKASMIQNKLGGYVQQILEKSTITYYDAKGKEMPFTKIPPAGAQ